MTLNFNWALNALLTTMPNFANPFTLLLYLIINYFLLPNLECFLLSPFSQRKLKCWKWISIASHNIYFKVFQFLHSHILFPPTCDHDVYSLPEPPDPSLFSFLKVIPPAILLSSLTSLGIFCQLIYWVISSSMQTWGYFPHIKNSTVLRAGGHLCLMLHLSRSDFSFPYSI